MKIICAICDEIQLAELLARPWLDLVAVVPETLEKVESLSYSLQSSYYVIAWRVIYRVPEDTAAEDL